MRGAIECAGFTPGEADQLRRAMATFKLTGGVTKFKDKLVDGTVERGYACRIDHCSQNSEIPTDTSIAKPAA